jgi:hypothetical protein
MPSNLRDGRLINCLRGHARLQARRQGFDSLAYGADAGPIGEEAYAAESEPRGRIPNAALAYAHEWSTLWPARTRTHGPLG